MTPTDSIFVKPATGPDGQPVRVLMPAPSPQLRPAVLPEAGKRVPKTAYWLRRCDAGDVVEVAEPQPAPVEPPAAEAPASRRSAKES